MKGYFLKIVLLIIVVAILGAGGWYAYTQIDWSEVSEFKTPEETNIFVHFDMEVFDIILDNYWQKASEADLAEFFQLSLMNAASTTSEILLTKDRAGTAKMIDAAILRTVGEAAKRDLALRTVAVVLFNLPPQGRNALYSQVQEREMRDTVANIDRSKDLYESLGLAKGAGQKEIELAYETKKEDLLKDSSDEAKRKLEELEYSHQVLADESSKSLYDETAMEPTIFVKKIGKNILYADMKQFSPASFGEFAQAISDLGADSAYDKMIIDLRGNIGGSLDFVQYFMAFFFGPNQYAFDIFHQGEYETQRTPNISSLELLKKLKEIAILTDSMTQSSAELTAAIFKRFNLGTVVGTQTRGWGTVENTYPISTEIDPSQKYSVFLVNSLTLRDDNQPVEGRGVDPNININDSDWKSRLFDEFQSPDFVKAIISQFSSVK